MKIKKLIRSKKRYINTNNQNEDKEKNDFDNFDDFDDYSDNIDSDDNQIYFYCPVTKDNILTLNNKIRKTTNKLLNFSNTYNINKENLDIILNINSEGGDLFQSLLGMDIIKKNKIPITTIVSGVSCSGATFLSIVGKKRLIHEHSFMLIHQLSSGVIGKYEEMEEELFNCKNFMQIMKDIYSKYTKIPSKKLNEILKHDIYFTPKECLQYGLVDEII